MIDVDSLIVAAERDKNLYQELFKAGSFNSPVYNPLMRQCHEENAALLENFIANYGWPFPEVYGQEAHEAAWLIAIHAISKPHFIKQIAAILKVAWQEGKLHGKYYAHFYDRIELYEGREQLYGTHLFESPIGWQAKYLHDPATINERRAIMDLPPLEEWIQEATAGSSGMTDKSEELYKQEFDQWCKNLGWRR